MKLTKSSGQAALAMAYLVNHGGDRLVQARQVAAHLQIPTDSALKILQVLARQKLIDSQLGRTGGYRLNRASDQISLLEIIEAIDGPINGQTSLPSDDAAAGGAALLRQLCDEAAQSIRTHFGRVTLADLARTAVAPDDDRDDHPNPQINVSA